MNANQVLQELRQHDVDLQLKEGKLVLRGSGPALPAYLQDALRENSADLASILAASVTTDEGRDVDQPTMASALATLRYALPASLAELSDDDLLVLVRHAVQHAKEQARGRTRRYCPDCGLPLSVVAVSDRCGFCGSPQRHGS